MNRVTSRAALGVGGLALLCSCARPREERWSGTEQIHASLATDSIAIRAALERWASAYWNKDLTGMLATWAPEAMESFPSGSRGVDEIRRSYEAYVASPRRTRQFSDVQRLDVSRDLAYSEAIWTALDVTTDSAGREVSGLPRRSRSLETWRRQPSGQWRIVRSVAFSIPPSPNADSVRARDIETAIRASLNAYAERYNSGRPAEAFRLIGEPGQIGWGPTGREVPYDTGLRAAEQAEAQYRSGSANPVTTYAVTVEEVLVAGQVALVRDVWTVTRRWRDADSVSIRAIRSLEFFRHQADGTWKIARWMDVPYTGPPRG